MSTYIFNKETMFSDIADGVAIIINSVTGVYYGMNGFGTAIFENLLQGASTEDILAVINKMPNTPDDMETRLQAFVNSLVSSGIMKEQAGSSTEVTLDAAVAQADSFNPTVDEFRDAQELLLADPIHEVKNDTGWQPDKKALETDAAVVKAKEDKMKK